MRDATTPDTTIPGPPPSLLLGSRGNLIRYYRDPIAYMESLQQRYGEVVAFVRGNPALIFAFAPAQIRQVLGNPELFQSMGLTMPGPPDSAQRRLGASLFRMNDDPHKQQRRLMSAPLQPKCVEGYCGVITGIAADMLAAWTPGRQIEIAAEMKRFTLLVAAKILLGLENPQECLALSHEVDKWLEMNRSVRVRFAQVDLPGWPYHAMLRRAERLETQAQAMIDGKRAAGGPGHDVLSLLLQGHGENNATVSAEELVGQTITLVAAGSETTASSLVWTLFLLSQHPAVAEEVANELESKLRGRLPAPEQLEELTALDGVIRESLRLLPPGFHSSRKAIGPFELGRYAIAKGTTVAFSPYITHRRADLYPQPLRFQPERWRHIKPSMYEYLPFGAGPHSCIGASLALTTMKSALAVILQRCRLALVPGADISRKTTITLWPKYGMPMVVHGPGGPFGGGRARGNIREMVELP